MKWLSGLFKHLHEQLEQCPCTTTMHFTIDFLRNCDDCEDCKVALEYLADHGGFCDCEVLMNVERKNEISIEDDDLNIEDGGRDNGRIHRN